MLRMLSRKELDLNLQSPGVLIKRCSITSGGCREGSTHLSITQLKAMQDGHKKIYIMQLTLSQTSYKDAKSQNYNVAIYLF
jgi:hypothetical protein